MAFLKNTLPIVFILLLIVVSDGSAKQILSLQEQINHFSAFSERTTGSKGCEQAVDLIRSQFQALDIEPQSYRYPIPVRKNDGASLLVGDTKIELDVLRYNAVTPEATNGVLSGPLYYVGSGSWADIKGMDIENAIIFLDADSGQNWQQMASLGVKAIIYVNDSITRSKFLFEEKEELTPIQLPCFWMEKEKLRSFFTNKVFDKPGQIAATAELASIAHWQEVVTENIYGLIPGTDPELTKELLIVEAFYDASGFVVNHAPGADEASSIVTLLQTAATLRQNPPKRSVLLVANSGHNQSLAGMRDLFWSLSSKKKLLKGQKKRLKSSLKETKQNIEVLSNIHWPLAEDHERDVIINRAMADHLKLSVDKVSRELIALRLRHGEKKTPETEDAIKKLSKKSFTLPTNGVAFLFS